MIINGGTINGGYIYDLNDLFIFSSFTFTSNIVGERGPTLGNLYNTYSNTGNTWITNTEYFTVPNAWRGYQIWTVPRTGAYQITAAGSRSGCIAAFAGNTRYGNSHGRGAVVQGVFNLTRGQKITLVVGQPSANTIQPSTYSSPGGGGGSFVVLGNIASDGPGNVVPLIIGGGGGAPGAWTSNTNILPGGYGVTTKRGGNSAGNLNATITTLRFGAPGGVDGLGGNTHVSVRGNVSLNTYDAGAGGGFSGNGSFWTNLNTWSSNTRVTAGGAYGGGGNSFQNGAVGGVYSTSYAPPSTSWGGFGGGGGSGPITGGGGGGYSGGGGAFSFGNPSVDSGGGGGSYIDSNASSVATSDGLFDNEATFNGASITNLGFYNNTAGYITIVKL